MFRYFLLAVIVYTTVESVQADGTNYTYSFKTTKMSAEMAFRMREKLWFKIIDLTKKVEEKSKYLKAMYVYAFSTETDQAIGGFCSTKEDMEKLDNYTATFKAAFTNCSDVLNYTTSYNKIIDDIVVEIQTIDQNTKTVSDACSGDQTCETEAYKSMRDSLNDLYKNNFPTLRVEEDEVKAKAISETAKCMIPKIAESYETMVRDTARIQACLALGTSENEKSDENETTEEETQEAESEDDPEATNSEVETETAAEETTE